MQHDHGDSPWTRPPLDVTLIHVSIHVSIYVSICVCVCVRVRVQASAASETLWSSWA